MGDHGARPNHDMVADAYREKRGVTANRYVIANTCRFPEFTIATSRTSCCVTVVDKHDAMGDGTVAADGHLFADKGVGLNARTSSDADSTLDFYEGADEDIVSHSAIVQVDGFGRRYAVAELYVSGCNGLDAGVHRIFE